MDTSNHSYMDEASNLFLNTLQITNRSFNRRVTDERDGNAAFFDREFLNIGRNKRLNSSMQLLFDHHYYQDWFAVFIIELQVY